MTKQIDPREVAGLAETIRDTIAAALRQGSNVSIVVDDTGDTITIGSTGSALTIQDENGNVATSVTQIDFQGAGVAATAGTGEVVVTIPGGGTSGGGQLLERDGLTPPLAFSDLLTNEAQDTLLYSD